jgi:hypothetical protein
MKNRFLPLLLLFMIPASFSCSSSRFASYTLNEADAALAVRQLLELGLQDGSFANSFSKESIMTAVFPEGIRKTLNTLNQLGITSEIDRFTTTLATAAEKSATRSVPIFVSGIGNLRFTDAMRIVRSGGTAATDYLRSSVGDSLRRAIRPVMQEAINEYKLEEQWNSVIRPIKDVAGSRLNLDLATLMAGAVSEAMFRKIEEKERQVRAEANARTTPLLQKVFYNAGR